jgi:hypothetical protein
MPVQRASSPTLAAEREPAQTPGVPLTTPAAQLRQDRLRQRREALQAQGVRDVTRQLAIEEGISAKRVRSILRRP